VQNSAIPRKNRSDTPGRIVPKVFLPSKSGISDTDFAIVRRMRQIRTSNNDLRMSKTVQRTTQSAKFDMSFVRSRIVTIEDGDSRLPNAMRRFDWQGSAAQIAANLAR
jgi:hypothetical protein